MKHFFTTLLIACICNVFGQKIPAKSLMHNYKSKEVFGCNIYYENDHTFSYLGLKKWNRDQNYTTGLAKGFTGNWIDRAYLTAPHDRFMHKVFEPKLGLPSNTLSLMRFSLSYFTPLDIDSVDVIANDRPYASLLALEVSKSYIYLKGNHPYSLTFQLGIGFLGLPIAKMMQSAMHADLLRKDTSARPVPLGWHNQISNGFEPTALVTLERTERACFARIKKDDPERGWFDLKYSLKGSFGWYIAARAGSSIRIGYIKSRNSLKTHTPSENVSRFLPQDSVQRRSLNERQKCLDIEGYLLGGVDVSLIAYNALVHGQFRHTAYRLPYKNFVPGVLQMYGGAALSFLICGKVALDIGLVINTRSPEFIFDDRPPRWHAWPSAQVGLSVF